MSPQSTTDGVDLKTKKTSLWNVGDVANFTWNPSSLVIDELMTEIVKVDISMWIYNNFTKEYEENILGTDLPNSGHASIVLPDSITSSVPRFNQTLHLSYAKVGVNMTTSEIARSKRSISSIRKIAGKIAKYGKAGLIGAIKVQVVSRLLCEAFVLLTPPFPTRSIPPCPCNEEDAMNDDRFETEDSPEWSRRFFHPKSKGCFRQANVR